MTIKFFGLKNTKIKSEVRKDFVQVLKDFAFQSPWGDQGNTGQGNKPNDNNSFGPKNQNPNNQKPKNSEDFSKKFEKFFKKLSNEGSSGSGGSKNIFDRSNNKTPKSVIGLIILFLIFLWLSSGVYKVDSDENAVVLYFGKFYSVETPGLNYHIPFPFGKVIKKSVTIVNTEEFGFVSNSKKDNRNLEAESLMLTGDENIVDIEFQVQWQISDIKNFVFNIAEPNQAIRKTAESAMREIIARTPIVDALSDGKKNIESETKNLLQQVLDQYGAGVRVVLVQLRRVDPPLKVIDAFRDVQTAKADKEKEINQAQAYANDIIPRARGLAAEMEQQSQAFSQEVVANAKGEAGRFVSIYNQYVKAKQVTKKRMYLETMEKIYRDMDKVVIDKNASKAGVIPYFPLNEMPKQTPIPAK
jgi:membrane protease subunit HflK